MSLAAGAPFMPQRIEDYGLIGDTQTAALVGRDGSIDWLCLPHFDSDACFSALLGNARNGRWLIHPSAEARATQRRYRPDTLILETDFHTASGDVRVIDFMTPAVVNRTSFASCRASAAKSVMRMELVIRLDYGSVVPWMRRMDGHLRAIGGRRAVALDRRRHAREEPYD